MPFKSKSQMRRMAQLVKEGKLSQGEYDKHQQDTPNVEHLPDRAKPPRVTKAKKVKTI